MRKINPTPRSKKALRKGRDRIRKDQASRRPKKDSSKTEGIEPSEIERWKVEGECLWCAWPSDRNGTHRVKDCIWPIKLD